MTIVPRDPFSEVVDERRRWNPEWFSWLTELTTMLNRLSPSATTVGSLPTPSVVGAGARAFVTDATSTAFHSTVLGGGTNKVPVVSDGTNWLIG